MNATLMPIQLAATWAARSWSALLDATAPLATKPTIPRMNQMTPMMMKPMMVIICDALCD